MECLQKITKTGKVAFCKDDLDFDRYSGIEIMDCQRIHNVSSCSDCKYNKSHLDTITGIINTKRGES